MSWTNKTHTQNPVEPARSPLLAVLANALSAANQPPVRDGVWQRPDGDWTWDTRSSSALKAKAARPLGNKRENVGGAVGDASRKPQENKDIKRNRRDLMRELHADQRTAASIYKNMSGDEVAAGRGVCLCGWTRIKGRPTELKRVDEKDGPRAFYAGLSKCDLRWVCPVCTRSASEAARERLNLALEAARAQGATPVMLTLTARHHVKMSLKEFWSRLSTAEKRLKGLTRWKNMNGPDGSMIGFAKAVEATHGTSGWHPHFHIIAVMRQSDEGEAMEALEWLRAAWLHQLERVGLDGTSEAARRRAFQMQGAAAAGSYVTKWGAAEELALSSAKTGRSGGRSPWQLLRDARVKEQNRDRQVAASLWWEFIQAFKGVHQLRLSPGLKALIANHKAENPAPEDDEEKPDPETIIVFSLPEWEVGRWRRLMMREAAEDAPSDEAKAAVLAVLMGDVTDRDLLEPDEVLIESG